VKAAPFEYDAPTTPDEAVGLLAEHGDEAKVLAGGQSLIPMLALRLAIFERLVDIGRISGRCGFAVEEFARRHGDFAIAGTAVAVQLDDDRDHVRRCAISLIGMSSVPVRAALAEAAAAGVAVDALDPAGVGALAAAGAADPPSDLHGTAGYRRRVCAAVVARAWSAAIEEARGG
jgi:CO/xanthine dehydrogenase FAD-binding subunit